MIQKMVFMGSKLTGVLALKALYEIAPQKLSAIITFDDRQDTRCNLAEFKSLSQKWDKGLHVLKAPSELELIIEAEKPDLCVVVGWYWIINSLVLDKVPHGFIGIHSSLLPQYRGGAPLVWPIINGDTESGISLFYLDQGMDTGDILGQARFSIGPEETIADILAKAQGLGVDLIKEKMPLVLAGKAPRFKQQHQNASYCSQRFPADGRIDWSQSHQQIHNAIRAQTKPYPGAFCFTPEGQKLYLWRSSRFESPYYGPQGRIVEFKGQAAIVTCGQGAIMVEQVQLENGEVCSPREILKLHSTLK